MAEAVDMIEWTTIYCDSGTCKCPHDHGAYAIDEDSTQFASARCPVEGCVSCEGIVETRMIPSGSHGPVLVKIDRAAEAAAQVRQSKLDRLLALPDERIE